MTTSLAKRIKMARIDAGLSQQDLANAISNTGDKRKITRTAIAQWESGVTKTIEAANLLKAAEVLNLRPEWVQFGVGNMRPSQNYLPPGISTALIIPVFNCRQAINHTGRDNVVDYIGIDQKLMKVSSLASFAIIVEDDSMSSILKPSDLVIIDPEIKPQPGEIVAAKLPYDEFVMLRKYRPSAINNNASFIPYELVPVNEDWLRVTIHNPNEGQIIGTLIEHRCRRRIKQSKKTDT